MIKYLKINKIADIFFFWYKITLIHTMLQKQRKKKIGVAHKRKRSWILSATLLYCIHFTGNKKRERARREC